MLYPLFPHLFLPLILFNLPAKERNHVKLITLKGSPLPDLEHVTCSDTAAYTVIEFSVISVLAAGENNLPRDYIQTLEDWCLCQAITSLEETGKLSEAEALCNKV